MNYKIENDFRIRGESITRLETFFDAAFAFSITMLVISVGSIPENYADLVLAIKKVPSFALSFAGITWIWMGHRRWSKWFGLEDGPSIIITLSLIFVMLVYIYPLRLIFSAMLSWITGNWLPSEFLLTENFQLTDLFVFYGVGFFALCGLLAMLFKHALLKKQALGLSPLEMLKTRSEYIQWSVAAFTGLFSAIFALVMPLSLAVFAAFAYSTLAISMPILSIMYGRKIKKLKE